MKLPVSAPKIDAETDVHAHLKKQSLSTNHTLKNH